MQVVAGVLRRSKDSFNIATVKYAINCVEMCTGDPLVSRDTFWSLLMRTAESGQRNTKMLSTENRGRLSVAEVLGKVVVVVMVRAR